MWVVKKVIILGLGALALLPAAYAAPARTAHVTITELAPFTVHGSGFVAGERVTITVEAKQRAVRRAMAGVRGGFTARFATVNLANCTPYLVRAVGNRGSVATRKVSPECAAPIMPLDPTPKKP